MLCYVTENCVDISEVLDIPADMAEGLRKCAIVRNKTLDLCYAIPGYAEKPIEEKARIYDSICNDLKKQYNLI